MIKEFQYKFITLLVSEITENSRRENKIPIDEYKKAMGEAWSFFRENFSPSTDAEWEKMVKEMNELGEKYR